MWCTRRLLSLLYCWINKNIKLESLEKIIRNHSGEKQDSSKAKFIQEIKILKVSNPKIATLSTFHRTALQWSVLWLVEREENFCLDTFHFIILIYLNFDFCFSVWIFIAAAHETKEFFDYFIFSQIQAIMKSVQCCTIYFLSVSFLNDIHKQKFSHCKQKYSRDGIISNQINIHGFCLSHLY